MMSDVSVPGPNSHFCMTNETSKLLQRKRCIVMHGLERPTDRPTGRPQKTTQKRFFKHFMNLYFRSFHSMPVSFILWTVGVWVGGGNEVHTNLVAALWFCMFLCVEQHNLLATASYNIFFPFCLPSLPPPSSSFHRAATIRVN